MNNVSMTGVGMITFVALFLLKHFGVDGVSDQVTKLVTDVLQDGAFIISIIGQLRRQDLHIGLIRKNK